MNSTISFNQLANIEIQAPLGSTSFHTSGENIVFLIGSKGQFIDHAISHHAAKMLKTLYNIGGSQGWTVTGAGK